MAWSPSGREQVLPSSFFVRQSSRSFHNSAISFHPDFLATFSLLLFCKDRIVNILFWIVICVCFFSWLLSTPLD